MGTPDNRAGSSCSVEVLRLRAAARCACRRASLRVTKLVVAAFFLFVPLARASTYYVSASTGNDANAGSSSAAAWQTIAKVNAQAFAAGDSILLKRGDVWNESLVPPSSGSSGNPIAFDAYGTGAPPTLTGYYAIPASGWVNVTGNAWKAAVPATFTTVNFCLFGSVWGQKVGAATTNLTAQWDFYLASGHLYVYSVGNPANYAPDGATIVPMALSNVPVININGKSWLTFQHLLVNWFDQYGVYVQGTSDHLVFANMEADSMIPQGTQPLGFYVNESTPGPGDLKIYNSEAHMNYDGFRLDGVATAVTMVNDKAYANRDAALVDNTGAVTYSYCHFYASSLAVAGSTDVLWVSGTGPIAGAGNVAADVAPAVQAWQRYPAEVTLTVDDAGMTTGADTYYAGTVLPIADAAGVPVGAAITVGYTARITPIVAEIQGWINAGRDVTSHSVSHTYYTNTDALDIQYTGTGTAATLAISGKVLTITVTGAADSVSYNLAQGQPQGTILGLEQALTGTGHFTATENPTCQGPYGTGCSANTKEALLAQDLADVSGQNVKSAVYAMQLDVTRLTTDEITLSRQWMTANLTGLPATPVYVYPGGYETPTMQGIAASVPYTGARGALKEDLGVKDTYASGFDVQNITSFGVNPTWQSLAASALNQKVQALIWKQRVWGVPWGIFWHLNELNSTEITNLIADLQNGGATIQKNTDLVNWLKTGTLEAGTDGNFYYKSQAASMGLDFRPTASSPVVDAGQNLGTAYQIDINGLNQNSFGTGWEIGAHAFVGYSVYGEGTGSSFSTTGTSAGQITGNYFGMHINRRGTGYAAPTLPFGGYRTIDSFGTLWNGIETSAGVYDFTRLDARLADAQAEGVDVLYTIYATPTFHSSTPTDSSCGEGNGACEPPSDVNADGSGTDASLIAFLTALVNHVGSQVQYYEMWNEANISVEWNGTWAQLVRMAQDARAVILAVNPRARILSPSFAELTYPTAAAKEAAYLSTVVNGSTGSQAADIINFHGYVVTPSLPVPIAEYQVVNVNHLRGDLTSADLAKPLWDTEWGYGVGLSDPDLNSGFVARHMLIEAGQGVARTYYYDWDSNDQRALWSPTLTNCLGAGTANGGGYLCETGIAYQQVESWLLGNAVTTPCSGPMPPATGVWTCGLTMAGGIQGLAVWDTGPSWSSGSGTTSTYSYDARFTQYLTRAGGSGTSLSGGTVQVGAKPILLTQ